MRKIIIASVAGLFSLTGAGWLYLQSANKADEGTSCAAAEATAKLIAPFAEGDLAAFTPHVDNSRQVANVAFNDVNGEPSNLEAFRGKITLINLWATWCVPCRVEMPEFDALQASYGGDSFTVLPISLDAGSTDKPKAFYEEIGLKSLPFYHDGTMRSMTDLRAQGLTSGLPTTILVDETGCSIGHIVGPAHWAGPVARRLIEVVLQKPAS